jgi:16S rRNA (uracil1498-N3)-methyltransferase
VPIFFVDRAQVGAGGDVRILGRDAWHISKVLRSRRGDLATIVVEDGGEHDIRLDQLGSDEVVGTIVASRSGGREPRAQIHVVQGLPKGQGMSEICERLSELGAASIWPAFTARSVPRLDGQAASTRTLRWQTIAKEAAQLAGRHQVPPVHSPAPLLEVVAELTAATPGLQLLACHGSEPVLALSAIPWDPGSPTGLLIGPEGGFSPEEVQQLTGLGASLVSLGPRNLRAVLAGLVATTVLLSRSRDLETQPGANNSAGALR